MKVFWTLEKQSRQNLLILFASGILFWSSMASLLPTLPSYVEDIGGTKQEVGIVMGAFAIGLLAVRSWLGKAVDRGWRKEVLLLGTMAAALAPLGILSVRSIPWLIGIRIFHGLSVAAFTTAYSTLVVDLSPIRQRGEIIGYMSLVVPVGLAIGPAIGGLLEEAAGYTPLFLLAAGLGIISGAIAYLIPAGERKRGRAGEAGEAGGAGEEREGQQLNLLSEILFSSRLRTPTLVLLLNGLGFGALSTFVPLYIRETGVDLNPGWFYTAAAIASFSIRLFIGRASDRYGRGLFITMSLSLYAVAMVILSRAETSIAFLAAAVLEGAASGILLPMVIALLADRSAPEERGRIFAVCISGFDLGMAIAGPVLGSLADRLSYPAIFSLSTFSILLAVSIFLTQSSKSLPQSFDFALGRVRDAYALNK
ncbi:MAG: MFS transporter [Cyanosarcina radialis HA8281-LM2]|jgi:MFS family permease|nr:MFS transporter [Cyanosarcina radialis HA8281-LM2]